MLTPATQHGRVANSTMLGTAADLAEEPASPEEQRTFLETSAVAGKIAGS